MNPPSVSGGPGRGGGGGGAAEGAGEEARGNSIGRLPLSQLGPPRPSHDLPLPTPASLPAVLGLARVGIDVGARPSRAAPSSPASPGSRSPARGLGTPHPGRRTSFLRHAPRAAPLLPRTESADPDPRPRGRRGSGPTVIAEEARSSPAPSVRGQTPARRPRPYQVPRLF